VNSQRNHRMGNQADLFHALIWEKWNEGLGYQCFRHNSHISVSCQSRGWSIVLPSIKDAIRCNESVVLPSIEDVIRCKPTFKEFCFDCVTMDDDERLQVATTGRNFPS
jgi:hypothetical protein